MKIINNEETIWAEKYRPQCIDDLLFPAKEKEKFKKWIETGTLPNLGLFSQIPGTGKCHSFDTELEIYVTEDILKLLKD